MGQSIVGQIGSATGQAPIATPGGNAPGTNPGLVGQYDANGNLIPGTGGIGNPNGPGMGTPGAGGKGGMMPQPMPSQPQPGQSTPGAGGKLGPGMNMPTQGGPVAGQHPAQQVPLHHMYGQGQHPIPTGNFPHPTAPPVGLPGPVAGPIQPGLAGPGSMVSRPLGR